jgi:hypothetical protein
LSRGELPQRHFVIKQIEFIVHQRCTGVAFVDFIGDGRVGFVPTTVTVVLGNPILVLESVLLPTGSGCGSNKRRKANEFHCRVLVQIGANVEVWECHVRPGHTCVHCMRSEGFAHVHEFIEHECDRHLSLFDYFSRMPVELFQK